MRLTRYWIGIGVIALGLTACGGGSSGGAGGGVAPGLVGTYAGTVEVSVTLGGVTLTDTQPLTITVAPDGTVTLDSGDPPPLIGRLDGNRFTITSPAAEVLEDASCTGTVTLTGLVSESISWGDISSSGVQCADGAVTVGGDFFTQRT